MIQKGLLDKNYQKATVTEETKSLIQKITDKQIKFAELSKQLMDNVQKIRALTSRQFEKELKIKLREMRKVQKDHEAKIKEVEKEYEIQENNFATQMVTYQASYLQTLEQIRQEQKVFIQLFDHDIDNDLIMAIYEVLIDNVIFQESHRISSSSIVDFLHHKNKYNITSLHNSLKMAISQLQKLEELIKYQGSEENDFLQKLINFLQYLKSAQKELETKLSEMQQLQQESIDFDLIKKNNMILIQSLMKTNYDAKENDKVEYQKTNESIEKLFKRVLEINQSYMALQKQNQDDLNELLEITNLKQDKIRTSFSINRKSVMKFSNHLSQRLRIYSDNKQDPFNDLGDLTESIAANIPAFMESQQLYHPSPLLPQVSPTSVTQQTFFSSTSMTVKNEKQLQDSKHYRTILQADKKTALPLKCTCPPQCLCQAQIVIQFHSCNKQLFINSKGEIMCKSCNFTSSVQDYNFICPQFKTKNKFRNSKDFLNALWQHISSLTVNQQIVEFWNQLSLCCQQVWMSDIVIDATEQVERNLITYCPSESKCYHKSGHQQYHSCQSPLSLTSQGQIVCNKCRFTIHPNQFYVLCPETKQYHLFKGASEFIASLDLPYSKFDDQQSMKFIQSLEKILPLSWN